MLQAILAISGLQISCPVFPRLYYLNYLWQVLLKSFGGFWSNDVPGIWIKWFKTSVCGGYQPNTRQTGLLLKTLTLWPAPPPHLNTQTLIYISHENPMLYVTGAFQLLGSWFVFRDGRKENQRSDIPRWVVGGGLCTHLVRMWHFQTLLRVCLHLHAAYLLKFTLISRKSFPKTVASAAWKCDRPWRIL